jgi:protein gp37
VPEKLDEPLHWKKPKRVFVNSMGDLFHPKVSSRYIADVFAYMAYARQHTFIVLTKQPQRMQQLLTSEEFAQLYDDACSAAGTDAEEILGARREFDPNRRLTTDIRAMDPALPRPNIHLGVSVEDQATYEARVPFLLQTPAAVRFISAEPLLGAIDAQFDLPWCVSAEGRTLDWVIVGGESGDGARPMHPAWARSLRDQCQAAHVPFFFKQWGEWLPGHHYTEELKDRDSDLEQSRYECAQWDDDAWDIGYPACQEVYDHDALWRVGKKAAGRLLDGREWNEFPEARG